MDVRKSFERIKLWRRQNPLAATLIVGVVIVAALVVYFSRRRDEYLDGYSLEELGAGVAGGSVQGGEQGLSDVGELPPPSPDTQSSLDDLLTFGSTPYPYETGSALDPYASWWVYETPTAMEPAAVAAETDWGAWTLEPAFGRFSTLSGS